MRFPEWSLWLKTRTVPTRSNLAPRVCPADCTAMVGKGISKTILRPDCEPCDAASRCAEWMAPRAKVGRGVWSLRRPARVPELGSGGGAKSQAGIRWVVPRVLRGN